MSNIFKRLIYPLHTNSEEEKLLENDPVAEILERKQKVEEETQESPPKTALDKFRLAATKTKISETTRTVFNDPLIRLILDTQPDINTDSGDDQPDLENSQKLPQDRVAYNDRQPTIQSGDEIRTSGDSGPEAIQDEPEVSNVKPVENPMVQPDNLKSVINDNEKPTVKSGPTTGSSASDIQTTAQAVPVNLQSGNQTTVLPPGADVKLAASISRTNSVAPEKSAPTAAVKQASNNAGLGDVLDIFMEEDKKVKNEFLTKGLDTISSQQLLEDAETILATLKAKRRHKT